MNHSSCRLFCGGETMVLILDLRRPGNIRPHTQDRSNSIPLPGMVDTTIRQITVQADYWLAARDHTHDFSPVSSLSFCAASLDGAISYATRQTMLLKQTSSADNSDWANGTRSQRHHTEWSLLAIHSPDPDPPEISQFLQLAELSQTTSFDSKLCIAHPPTPRHTMRLASESSSGTDWLSQQSLALLLENLDTTTN